MFRSLFLFYDSLVIGLCPSPFSKKRKRNYSEASSTSAPTTSASSTPQDSKFICKKMKHHCSSSLDRISELPSNVIQTILMFIPLRDMVRTSVLSKNWRFQWVTVPQLVFDTSLCNKDIVFGTLLLHHGPIFKFKLDMSRWNNCSEINKIIPLLSRNGVQDLTFVSGRVLIPAADESDEGETECDKLPSSIFSCVELRNLSLTRCVFQPLTLVGFIKLVNIELISVDLGRNVFIPCGPSLKTLWLDTNSEIDCFSVEAPNLESLFFIGPSSSIGFLSTPVLKVLYLTVYISRIAFDLIKLLHSLPLLENLFLHGNFDMKSLVVGDSSNELPRLNNLEMLDLSLFPIRDTNQLSSVLLWIRSLPNLRNLKLRDFLPPLLNKPGPVVQMPQHGDRLLMKVREMEIEMRRDTRLCKKFIKFLLAISPVLKTLYIKPPRGPADVKMYKTLLELACSPRASPKAKIVILGLDPNQT